MNDKIMTSISGAAAEDGSAFLLNFSTADGGSKEIIASIEDWGSIVASITTLARMCSQNIPSDVLKQLQSSDNVTCYPIDAEQVRIASGRTQEDFTLSLQVGALRFDFVLPRTQIAPLQKALKQAE